jgi:hypothetical protein
LGALLAYQAADDPIHLTTSADAAAPTLDHQLDQSADRFYGQQPGPILTPSPEAVSAIRGRPLFVADRTPIVLAQQTSVSMTDAGGERSLPQVELAGTLLSERNKVALVVNGDEQPSRMRVGETIADWQIKRIESDRFLLERDGQVAPLLLREHQ